ncbi:MAG: hypothetical protein P1U85_05545 [Verrucomicrobiales bacterium]|nr:hypothetical protein [Verrucomicrobiales bacterium]
MKFPLVLILFALSSLAFTSCTTSSAPRSSGSYNSGNSGGGYFQRSSDDSWQDRTFRPSGY